MTGRVDKKKKTLSAFLGTETLTSPFSSERVEVILQSSTLHVHKALLADKPQLYSTRPTDPDSFSFTVVAPKVHLDGASLEVGHVFVMWLYTKAYQLLPGLGGAEPPTRDAFTTALGVYTLARQYTLSDLEALARDQITLLATQLDIYTAIDIIIETFPSQSKHDAWLSEFLYTRMKEALKNDPTSAVLPGEPCEPEEATPITKTIVKSLLDAYRETSENLAAREAALEEKLAVREAALEEKLAAKEAALEEAARVLVAQQMSFALDNAIKKSDKVPPPEPVAKKETDAPKPSDGSDCELAPKDVPSAFAAAVIEELAMPRPASASPENDWVVTSPPAAEPEQEELVISSRCKWCMKKKCHKGLRGLKCKKAPSTPKPEEAEIPCEPEAEPEELEIPCEPEAEPENAQEPAKVPEMWGFSVPKEQRGFGGWGFGAKKPDWGFGAKDEERKQNPEPEPEPVPVSAPEPPTGKKDVKKKKGKTSIWDDLEVVAAEKEVEANSDPWARQPSKGDGKKSVWN